jgi:hypothetical protein
MWSDANINFMQQQIIKNHLCFTLGKYLFIHEQQISNDCENYYVPTCYDENKYYKKGDKSQKSEQCSITLQLVGTL